MATVTTASSIFPGLSQARGGQAKLPRATVCHCRLPARRTEEVLNRRNALLGVLLSSAAVSSAPLLAPAVALAEVQEGFTAYEDEANKFSIVVPQGWQVGAGEGSGFKNVTAFFPDQNANSSASSPSARSTPSLRIWLRAWTGAGKGRRGSQRSSSTPGHPTACTTSSTRCRTPATSAGTSSPPSGWPSTAGTTGSTPSQASTSMTTWSQPSTGLRLRSLSNHSSSHENGEAPSQSSLEKTYR